MFNFSGKSTRHNKKLVSVNFPTFWKDLDDNYFESTTVESVELMYEKIVSGNFHDMSHIYKRPRSIGGSKEKLEQNTGESKYAIISEEEKQSDVANMPYRKLRQYNKRETNLNIVLGHRILSILNSNSEVEPPSTELALQIERITQCINYYQSLNMPIIKTIKQKIIEACETPNKFTEETQNSFLECEIHKLELKQLAESVLLITCDADTNFQYKLQFDPALRLLCAEFSKEIIETMSKYRKEIFNASPYDSAIASTKKFNLSEEEIIKAPIKKIVDLLDSEMINREIDFTQYGFCHHCKEILPINKLIKCTKNYNSHIINIFTKPNSFCNQCDESKLPCDRTYCFGCIFFNYDQDPKIARNNPLWICPYCQVPITIII